MQSGLSLFSRGYWREAFVYACRPRVLRFTVLAAAAGAALSLVSFPVADSLRFFLAFPARALAMAAGGPVAAFFYSSTEQALRWLIHPADTAAYCCGLPASLVSCLLYGLCLYRADITPGRLFLTKALVNLADNVIFLSWLNALRFGGSWAAFASGALLKNMLYLPAQALVLILTFQLARPMMVRLFPDAAAWDLRQPGRKILSLF